MTTPNAVLFLEVLLDLMEAAEVRALTRSDLETLRAALDGGAAAEGAGR